MTSLRRSISGRLIDGSALVESEVSKPCEWILNGETREMVCSLIEKIVLKPVKG